MDVAVFGSLNADVVFRCETLPRPGETILCDHVDIGPGGKGLNQAVAAARSGATAALLGAVGDDANGDMLLRFLTGEAIETDRVERLADHPTGLAHILVDRRGENSIVVAAGANAAAKGPTTLPAQVLLAQLEVSDLAVRTFFQTGSSEALRILNAAPAHRSARTLIPLCDVLVVNEHELAELADASFPAENEHAVAAAARSLLVHPDQTVVVTLGRRGTQWVTASDSARIETPKVEAIDTTGAGDCFCGVLAASLAGRMSVPDAITRANRAASIAVTRPGAALAMPHAAAIDEIRQHEVAR